jgi:hypothetical protein
MVRSTGLRISRLIQAIRLLARGSELDLPSRDRQGVGSEAHYCAAARRLVSRSLYRSTFPAAVLGNSVRNSMRRGYL